MKQYGILSFLSLYFLSCNLIYAGSTGTTPLSAKSEFSFSFELCSDTKTGNLELDKIKRKVITDMMEDNINASLDRIWNNRFNPNVPKCIQELIDSLKKVGSIQMFILPAQKSWEENDKIPMCVSDVSSNPYKTGYRTDGVWASAGRRGIVINGLWRDKIKPNNKCLDGLLAHELIHLALYLNEKNDIYQHIYTSYLPKYAHEGVAEDCSLKYFSCAPTGYMDEDDPRNPEGDDCDCKKVCIPCKDYCPPADCDCNNSSKKESTRYTGSSDSSGQNCEPPNPYGPGNDHGDDWLSFSDGIVQEYNIAPGSVIYQGGYYREAVKLLGGLKFDGDNTAREILNATPVLFFPSGSLFGKENDTTLKAILAEYIRLGGNIIVLAQQLDAHFSVLPGCLGTPLRGFGFRQDQACYSGSCYPDQIHPALSSLGSTGNNMISINTDGYFNEFSENCLTLLRRTKNRHPLAMVYYPFEDPGSGAILVTSTFTDWGAAHG